MSCCSDIPIINTPVDPSLAFNVVGRKNIKVTPIVENGIKTFYVEDDPFSAPSILGTANPLKEVGEEFDFTWNLHIEKGRENIVRREISPMPTPTVDLNDPFSVSVADQKKTSRLIVNYHNIEVEDAIGTIVERALSVNVVNRVYSGFSHKDGVTAGQTLNATDIAGFTSTLADNIKVPYGGVKQYAIPASGVLQYIYWIYEVGTTPINSMELSGLSFPVIFIPGTISIVNPHDDEISSNFTLVRSANKFGTTTLSLRML